MTIPRTGLSLEAERNKPLTLSDQMRDLFDRLEVEIGMLGRSTAAEALQIPALLDEATDMLHVLLEKGGALQGEEARLATLSGRLERKASAFMKAIGGAEALAAARTAAGNPPAERWWWHMEQVVARQQQAMFRRLVRYAAIGVAVLIALFLIYQQFFAPDPAVSAKLQHLTNAEAAAQEQDYQGALAEVELALTAIPDAAESLVLRGVLRLIEGDEAAATADFGAAKTALGDQADDLPLLRAQTYLRIGLPQDALRELEAALAETPDSAVGYYLQGIAYQALNHLESAVASFEQAADLANASGNSQIEAMARVQMAQVMQSMMMGGPPLTEPAAAP